ncbi:VOC family protein [Dokdonia sp.]|uniref:VOC family protein n=1 Tax=Dokdonia sp. TaxID=2024995 RepID=UPI00326702F7
MIKINSVIKRKIDHIVYAVSNLDEAIKVFEKATGISPIFGGYHTTEGTKNALVNLQDGVYLEFIAIDETNLKVPKDRWMGIDLLTKNQVTRFALKSNDLISDSTILKRYNSAMGTKKEGSRHTVTGALLQWELLMPLATPEVELIPFILDWSTSEMHPHDMLPDMNCTLIELYATHPKPESISPFLDQLAYHLRIEKSNIISLRLTLNTPNGIVHL